MNFLKHERGTYSQPYLESNPRIGRQDIIVKLYLLLHLSCWLLLITKLDTTAISNHASPSYVKARLCAVTIITTHIHRTATKCENVDPRANGEPLSAVKLHVWYERADVREGPDRGGQVQPDEGGF